MVLTASLTHCALFFFCLTTALAYRQETNAKRLSRGLPPARPNRLYDATRTGPALARRSVTPAAGYIAAYVGGAVNPTCYFTPQLACDPSISNAAFFSASVGIGSPTPQNIFVTAPAEVAGRAFLAYSTGGQEQGATVTDQDTIIGSYVFAPTAPGAPPTLDGGSHVYYETAIWSIAVDGTLTANWVNPTGDPQGDVVPLTFFQRSTVPGVEGSASPAYIAAQTGVLPAVLVLQGP